MIKNKYEDFVQKLIDETYEDKQQWKVAEYSDYAPHMLNADRIMRAFKTMVNDLNVVLLEFKGSVYSSDFDTYLDSADLLILLIKHEVLAKTITDKIVTHEFLRDLIEMVAVKTTDIDNDIDSFLEP